MMRSLRSWSKTLLTNAGWAIAYAPFQLSRMNESIRAREPIRPRSLSAIPGRPWWSPLAWSEIERIRQDVPGAVDVVAHDALATFGIAGLEPGDDLTVLVVGDLVVFGRDQVLDGEVPVADARALRE